MRIATTEVVPPELNFRYTQVPQQSEFDALNPMRERGRRMSLIMNKGDTHLSDSPRTREENRGHSKLVSERKGKGGLGGTVSHSERGDTPSR